MSFILICHNSNRMAGDDNDKHDDETWHADSALQNAVYVTCNAKLLA